MQPDNQNVQPNYDFIVNPQKPKKSLINLNQSSTAKRILVVIGAFFALLIIILIFKSILSTSSTSTNDLLAVSQDQNEILHILNNDLQNQSQNNVIDSANQAFSQTAIVTMNSYSDSLKSFLAAHGLKFSSDQLTAKESNAVDSEFSSATSSNDFNSVFVSVMNQQLSTYQSDLTKAYVSVGLASGKKLLKAQYQGTGLLIRELKDQYS